MKQKSYVFINLVKIIAAVLITNSHMESLYPNTSFAFGGALGNALFFVVSGFCLSHKRENAFILWMGDRLKRIYIPLWTVTLILVLLGDVVIPRSNLIPTLLLSHNSFWFVNAMIIFLPLFYLIRRYCMGKVYVVAILAVMTYLVWYVGFLDIQVWSVEGNGYFKYVFYFGVMLTGIIIKYYEGELNLVLKEKTLVLGSVAVLCFLGYVFMKILTKNVPSTMPFQFVIQIFTLGFAVSFFLFMWSNESLLKKFFYNKIYRIVADSTLEIYLINMMIISRSKLTSSILDAFIAFALIFVIGVVIHVASKYCVNKVSETIRHELNDMII